MTRLRLLILSILILFSCNRTSRDLVDHNKKPVSISSNESKLFAIPASPQREGNPEVGKNYLLEGDFLDSGIPLAFMKNIPGFFKNENILNRSGLNAQIPPEFTATIAANGTEIISPNCLQCHGAYIGDEYVLGLGNHSFDGTLNTSYVTKALGFMLKGKYPEGSPEWEAYSQFNKAGIALSGQITTNVVGTNAADKITEVLLAHRQLPNWEWSEEPLVAISDRTVPIDPPAWWILKKKNAEFTTGIGRGDFARISLASSLLTMKDVAKAKEIDSKFADVIAFIKSIEAPEYPHKIDKNVAAIGAIVFDKTCSKCHGKYGNKKSYPNYLVHHDIIKTDPTLAESYHDRKPFVDLYNNSWFGEGEYAAHIVPGHGYVAPPLDGIWATAPYLHNGSVPTIRELLDSPSRSQYWRRSFDTHDYNWEDIGWNYTSKESKIDKYTYDTTIEGYSNSGHNFGDKLTDTERTSVIEYLKTL